MGEGNESFNRLIVEVKTEQQMCSADFLENRSTSDVCRVIRIILTGHILLGRCAFLFNCDIDNSTFFTQMAEKIAFCIYLHYLHSKYFEILLKQIMYRLYCSI